LIDYNLYINNLDTMERQSLPNRIALRANNGQFVVAEGGGGGPVNANRNQIGPWETFTVVDRTQSQPQPPSQGRNVALRANNERFVSAEGGGGRELVANRRERGPWETFRLIDRGRNQVALQANNGQFVSAEGGGGRPLVANRTQIGPWETFTLVNFPGGVVALRANNGQYVRVRRNDNILVADFTAQPPNVSTSIFFEIVNVR
jgi:hypothetical protein